jgi:branched-chain amino acid transport system substrate-binding protein
MNFIKYTIVTILFFTSSCVAPKKDISTQHPHPIMLTDRMDKQTITKRFADLPFGSKEEIKIALLLPLTGKHQGLGKSLYEAAQLALFDHGDPRIVIYPFDSKASEFGAVGAMQKIIAEDIKVVIGPVFSNVIKAITPIAKENDLIMLTFSNNINVANNNIYIAGLDIRQQVQKIASYAIQNNIKYFSALLPGNDYGAQIVQELRKIVKINGGMVLKTEFYLAGKSLDKNVKRVISSVNQIPLNEDGEALFREVGVDEEIALDEGGKPLYQDIKSFKTAILISDNAKKISKITKSFEKHGFPYEKTKIIGLSLWDNNLALQNETLAGSWYVSNPKENLDIYKDHFEATYGHPATKISSLAYDLVSVIAAIAATQNHNEIITEKILNPLGFEGASGLFRFKHSGIVERLLNIYQVENNGVKKISNEQLQFEIFADNLNTPNQDKKTKDNNSTQNSL